MKGRIILRSNGLPVSPRTILTMTTLFVSATAEEAVHLPQDKQIIVTGVGLVAAATAVMEAAITTRPDRIVNLGTAGALADGHSGVYEITHVVQHDFAGTGMDDDFTQKEFELVTSGELPTARLASGDHFVSSTEERNRIVQLAELVDMEGFAVAWVGNRLGIPVTLLKQVSDQADEAAAAKWAGAVEPGAVQLAKAVEKLGL